MSSLAGAGSLSLEFSVLSALTGDGVFAEVNKQGGTYLGGGGRRMEGKGGKQIFVVVFRIDRCAGNHVFGRVRVLLWAK